MSRRIGNSISLIPQSVSVQLLSSEHDVLQNTQVSTFEMITRSLPYILYFNRRYSLGDFSGSILCILTLPSICSGSSWGL